MAKFMSWVDLEKDCPIVVDRISSYVKDFQSHLPTDFSDLTVTKNQLLEARGELDMMITTLIQLLYDSQILEKGEDRVLFAWLKEDLGRFMKRLDESERDLLIDEEFVDPARNRVSISRISAYAKLLKISYQSVIYESLLKSTKEYYQFEETDLIKRTPRAFLYILFHILQITLSVLGGLTREPGGMLKRRGMLNSYPNSWQSLMTPKGMRDIREGFKEDTGVEFKDYNKFDEDYFDEPFDEKIEDDFDEVEEEND